MVANPGIWPSEFRGFLVLSWLLVVHLTTTIGLMICPLPGWPILISTLTLAFLGGLGATICYHRALAHRSLSLHPIVQAVLIFFAMLTGVTPPRAWIPNHRYHHAKTDMPEDPSSPVRHGLWIAHVGWYWQPDSPIPPKYAADLDALSLRIWDWLLVPMFFIAFLGGALISLRGFFWLGAIRLTFTFHANSLVNSICHNRSDWTTEQDASCNVWWVMLPLLMLGENWHQNHHSSPSSARIGWNWLQPDLGYLIIIGLEKLGLANGVQHESRTQLSIGRSAL